ncbi:uncharacterized protein LOC111644100 [Copidosoma floridanum]|uniref:uncharacterized protein LOC111644100 n=1 Tax=Copidosoma floridanum TaxID=29053 RepID=UPI000C6F8722|nr:uncharacterized protein LOC111644100 [Copidosoma floridanum]
MSGEQEATDSRLTTQEEPGAMGDVLTKEDQQQHHCDSEAVLEQHQSLEPVVSFTEPQLLNHQPLLTEIMDVDKVELTAQAVLSSQVSVDSDLMSLFKPYENAINNGTGTMEIVQNDEYLLCKEQCLANDSSTVDDLCDCKECKWKKRDLSKEDFEEMIKCKHLGVNLRHYIGSTFHWFMETSGFSGNPSTTLPQPQDLDSIENLDELRKSVVLLCEKVPYQLFMWLVGQAQEFVIGVKVQLLTLLYDRSVGNLAEVFITKLLDGYEALLATAVHISDLLQPLQNELFSKVNLTWSYINKSLYQNYVFSDPLIQNNLPSYLGQLKECMKEDNSNKHLLDRYFAFNDEITKIGSLCPEIERLIDKYNAEQVTGSVMKKVREDFERFKTRLKLDLPIYTDENLEFIKEVDDSVVRVSRIGAFRATLDHVHTALSASSSEDNNGTTNLSVAYTLVDRVGRPVRPA